MSYDDLEALARECIGHEYSLPPGWIASDVHHLARALLDVLPVVRAAEAYRDASSFECFEATQLKEAIDAWRAKRNP